MSERLNGFSKAQDELSRCVDELTDLSRAFRRVGNREVAVELREVARTVADAGERMQRAFSQHLDESYKAALENSGLLLSAALTGAEIERKNKGE